MEDHFATELRKCINVLARVGITDFLVNNFFAWKNKSTFTVNGGFKK